MSNDNFDTLDDLPTIPGDDGGESRMLADRYRIIRKLGEGGMGLVYLAEDTEISNEKVAIKFIPPTLATNARALQNLAKEAGMARKLSHPNIVRLHDLHTDGHQKFLVMEYIDGKTLDDTLAEKEDGKFTLEALLSIAEQIAAGLDHAHRKSVLHRDLKPSNIMIGKNGTVKLLDFGIAREMKDSFTRLTGKETSGTLPYMSPQQLMGEQPTPAMDVYSFAAVLYECLCGHPPFYMGDIREQIKSKVPDTLTGVNSVVNDAILSGLSKDPAIRPKGPTELVKMLKERKEVSSYRGTLRQAKTRDLKSEEAISGNKLAKVFAAVLIIAVLAGGSYIAVRFHRQDKDVLSDEKVTVLTNNEESFRNFTEAGSAYEAKQDWGRAIESYSEAIKLKPDDSEIKAKLATCQHNLYLSQAQEAESKGQLDTAISLYTKALSYKHVSSTQERLDATRKAPQDKTEQQQRRQEYANWIGQAETAEKQGDLDKSIELYRKAQQFVETEDAASIQAKIDSLQKQIAEKQKKGKFDALLANAESLGSSEATGKEALKILEEALTLYPDNSEALALKKKISGYFGPNPGDVVTNSIGMKLIYIPAGSFMMGNPSSEEGRSSGEGPQHQVQISKGFYMGVYEVTQAQWQAVMGSTVSQQRNKANSSWPLLGEGDDYPIYYVSWDEAVEFCKKLSRQEGKTYRLPTEAEWEYACRAETQTRFSFGDSDSNLGEYAWYSNNSGQSTHPVGKKRPNAFGLYDLHGNVWEWCSDWYGENYYSSSPGVNPQGPSSGSSRVLRGGSWGYGPWNCRSAIRVRDSPDHRGYDYGFRIVLLDF
ncbi:SUMF1/EgtB/PvdO family nonheme iron enzyme [Planctomycetota bacterium]